MRASKRIPWLLALVIAFVVLVPASSLAQASGSGSGDILGLGPAAAIRAQEVPPADPDSLVPPDEIPPPPNSPIVALTAVVDQLDLILDAIGSPPRGESGQPAGEAVPQGVVSGLEAARRHTLSALDRFMGDAVALHETADSIELAVVALEGVPVRPGSPGEALVDSMAARLTGVARKMAVDILVRARAGGVPTLDVIRGAIQLLNGDQLVARGDFGGGVGQYGNALSAGDTLVFDLDTFQINIILAFENETVGYSYAIVVDGQLQRSGSGGIGPDGLARTSADPPETPQSPTKEMNIASISKPITAVALLRLMEEDGIDPDDSVEPYLPPSWDRGFGIDDLTFRELMTHRSGLNFDQGGPYDYDSLRTYVEQGVFLHNFKYQNSNFALLARVILPMLLGIDPELAPNPPTSASAIYRLYVAGNLFQPIGVVADCLPNDPAPTLQYGFPYDGSQGLAAGDWTLLCGSGGWYLSAVELLNFFAHVRYNDAMLSPLARQQMDFGFLGWHDPELYGFASGAFGTYRGHGGDLPDDVENPTKGVDTCFMNFPEGVQISLLVNSIGGDYGGYQCSVLKQAYEGAWVAN